jgi:hypothetical protein
VVARWRSCIETTFKEIADYMELPATARTPSGARSPAPPPSTAARALKIAILNELIQD